MARLLRRAIALNFPNLGVGWHRVSSKATPWLNWRIVSPYNCIAFAAGDYTRWWEPDAAGNYYWPPGVTRDYRVESYVEAFESLGYQRCESTDVEIGFQKVAIYVTRLGNAKGLSPGDGTHAAIQTIKGAWKSKIGEWQDITHECLECLNGEDITGDTTPYGEPYQILKRRRQQLPRTP